MKTCDSHVNEEVKIVTDEEDGLGDDNDSVDDKSGDEEIYAPVDVVDETGGDEQMYAPVVCIGPLKGQSKGHSGTYHVHQDGADAIFASSIDGNISIFVTVNFFYSFYSRYRSF